MNIFDRLLIRICSVNRKTKILRKYMAHIGENTALCNNHFGKEPYLIWIGDDVIVATGVQFVTHDASYYNAYRYKGLKGDCKTEKMGRIVLKNNCFIGINSILLPNITVGENSVIAANSVVNKSIPDNEVWGGSPARYIMSTSEYAEKVIREANELPWISKDLSEEQLRTERIDYYLNRFL